MDILIMKHQTSFWREKTMHNSDMEAPGSFNGSGKFEHNQTLNESITNVSLILDSDTNTLTEYSGPPAHDPPIPLLIASSVAAVSILIFICLAYYCHSLQLDSRARHLAVKLATRTSFVGVPPSFTSTSIMSATDSELSYQKRRNTLRAPSLTPSVPSSRSLRGSVNWSALADHDIVTYSAPRRHSTFIIWQGNSVLNAQNLQNMLSIFILYNQRIPNYV